MKFIAPTRPQGFTLIEVMVSLGIFTFGIVVIMASLGVSSKDAGNDARRSLAVEILHNCFKDLEFAMVSGVPVSPTFGLNAVSWTSSAPTTLWFDANGTRVDGMNDAFFKCELIPTLDTSGNSDNLGHLSGRVEWPAKRGKGAPDGEAELFSSLILP